MSVLDTEIMNFEGNSWMTRDAATGLMCFGMTGSGKSSGPLRSIAMRFLELGYGGIVFCAKPDEYDTWIGYAKEQGRGKDIILLSKETFCFLDYEFSRPAEEGGGQVENVVNIFLEVVKITKDKKQGGTSDEYWQNAIKQVLRNTITILVIAGESVTLPNIKSVIDTVPRNKKMAESQKVYLERLKNFAQIENNKIIIKNGADNYDEAIEAFESEYFCGTDHKEEAAAMKEYCSQLFVKAVLNGHGEKSDYDLGLNFFFVEFPNLDERTRSNTISSFTVLADAMLRGEFLRCFGAKKSSLVIEDLYRKGKILIVDQDVKRHGLVGQMTAAIVKLCFEKMIERREDIAEPDARPVFLWGDECQYFTLDYDQIFQTTARSSRTLTVYATQNLDNLYNGYGKEQASSLLGNLGTKIFCQNGDYNTNKWAADSIGQEVLRRRSQNFGDSKSGGMRGDYNKSDNYSEGWSEQKDYKVDIVQFTTLQTGGPRGHCQVGYIFWQSGRVLKNGDVFVRSTIKQKCRRVCGAKFERHCPPVPKVGKKDANGSVCLYWYDYLTFFISLFCFLMSAVGIYLIYSEQDILLLPMPKIGIITVATLFLWFAGFAFDTMWASLAILIEFSWLLIRKKPRRKCKVINRVPLIVITWLYLGFSIALAVTFQNYIYEQKPLLPVIGLWLAASIAHRLFKSAGGRKIPVD